MFDIVEDVDNDEDDNVDNVDNVEDDNESFLFVWCLFIIGFFYRK